MKKPPQDGMAICESLYGSGQEQTTISKIAKPTQKNNNIARTAQRLAVLYETAEYGIEPFLNIFEALTDKYDSQEREEVRRLFNANISKNRIGQ